MKKFAKLLVLLLTVALICGAIAMVASAEEAAAPGTNIKDAIDNATDGKVTLTENAYLSETVTIDENLTIDLAGYTLTVNTATAFNVTANVEFNIAGNGAVIELGGCLMTSGAGVTPTTVVSNAKINHSGKNVANNNYTIVDAYSGTYTFDNINVVSTAAVPKNCYTGTSTHYAAFFNMSRPVTSDTAASSNIVGANVSFLNSSFICETSANSTGTQPGMAVFNVVGDGRLTVKNSYVKNAGAILHVGYARPLTDGVLDGTVQNVTVENSTMMTNPISTSFRVEFMFGHVLKVDATATYGVYSFKDSYISNDGYRFAHFGGNTKGGDTAKIVLDNTVIRQGGAVAPESNNMLVRCIDLYLKNNSTIISYGNSLTGSDSKVANSTPSVYVEVGTRFNMLGVVGNAALKSYDFSTNTAGAQLTASDVVFDPVGNYDYPYVYGGTASTLLPAGAEKYEYTAFNYAYRNGTNTGITENIYGIYNENKGSWTGSDYSAFIHGQPKSGAVYDVTYGTNTAFKYWVSPIIGDANSKIGTTRKFSGSDTDPYFNFGDIEAGSVNAAFSQIGNYMVSVTSFDVATDSEYGYPESNLAIGARRTDGTKNQNGSSWGVLKADGTIVNNTLKDFPSDGVKFSTTEWNTITLVAFIGEAGGTGVGYFYVNGEYIGYTDSLYQANAQYLQGIRFIPKTNFNHTVGQSFLIDNLSRTRYSNYLPDATTATKENADKYAPAYVKNTNACNDNIIVGGNAYANLADAIDAATEENEGTVEQVLPVNVFVTLDAPNLINSNITIFTYGNTIAMADGSYPALIKGDKNAPSSYTFDAAYNEYVVQYWWLRPGYTSEEFDDTWYDEPEKYFYIQELKAGMTPAPAEGMIHYGSYDPETGVVKVHNGKWALPGEEETGSVFEPLALEYVMEMSEYGEPVMIAPYYEDITPIYYVADAEGRVLRAGDTNENFTTEFKTVTSGENKTITLLRDVALTSVNHRIGGKADPSVTSLNLNGHKLEWRGGGTMAFLDSNMTLNVYSTAPDAEIYHAGWDGSRLISQRIFAIHGAGGEDIATHDKTHDAHLNIGTIEGIEDSKGEYLRVYTSILAEGMTGNDTCSITVDGVYAERYQSESGGMVMTRYFSGDITVKNSTFVNYAGTMIRMISYGDVNVTPYVLFDNCTLINLGNVLFQENGDNNDEKQIEFRNCVISCNGNTDGVLADNSTHTVFSGTNVVSDTQFTNDEAFAGSYTDGVKVFAYNAPVTLASLGLEDKGGYAIIKRLGNVELEDGTTTEELCDYYYAVVESGVEMTEEEYKALGLKGVYWLPATFKYAITDEANTATVTWNGADGAEAGNEKYYVGPTEAIGNGIPATAFAGATFNVVPDDVTEGLVATKKVFAGWDKDVTNIKENTVLNATYNVVANVENVKANISLYSDFDVNLYIPEIYRDFVTVMYGKKTLDKLATAREGYFKVTVDQLASEAASDVQFVVTVTEAGEIFTLNYSVNVANYAKYILEATEGYTEADKTLMKYVVAYANEAYKYAKGGAVNETLNTLATTHKVVPTTEKNYTAITNPAEISKVVKVATVILQSAPKFQFTVDKKFVGTVVIGGTEYTYTEASAEDRVVTVEGTRAYNFLDDITIKVGTAEGKYNYSAYAAYHVYNAKNGTDEESKAASANALALINALYKYVNYAKTYNANK